MSELTECAKMTNGLIRFRTESKVKEVRPPYDDPFTQDV